MKVTVTGALGTVGRETVKALLSQGNEIVCFERKTPAMERKAQALIHAAMAQGGKLEFYWGDIRREEDILPAIAYSQAVIHLAGIIPPLADHQPELARSVNVGGMQSLISAAKRLSRPPRIIFSSSIAVYGDRVETPNIRTEDRLCPSPGDHYAEQKIKCEALLRESGLSWTVFRLSYIAGRQRLVFDPIMFRMPLKTSIEICHARDAGTALAAASQREDIGGRVFNLGGGERCRTDFRAHMNRMLGILGLGGLGSRLEGLFSTRGYHCGWLDTAEEERLFHYQRHSLEDYYAEVQKDSRAASFFAALFRPMVVSLLALMGRPAAAGRG
jgi:nucleoside-diphosphate-sugar epimerase